MKETANYTIITRVLIRNIGPQNQQFLSPNLAFRNLKTCKRRLKNDSMLRSELLSTSHLESNAGYSKDNTSVLSKRDGRRKKSRKNSWKDGEDSHIRRTLWMKWEWRNLRKRVGWGNIKWRKRRRKRIPKVVLALSLMKICRFQLQDQKPLN